MSASIPKTSLQITCCHCLYDCIWLGASTYFGTSVAIKTYTGLVDGVECGSPSAALDTILVRDSRRKIIYLERVFARQ